MTRETDQQICDRVARELMGYRDDGTGNRWITGPQSACFRCDFRPCGPNADANDTVRVIDKLQDEGWRVTTVHCKESIYPTSAAVRCPHLDGKDIVIEDPDWGRAVCEAALAAKASEKPTDAEVVDNCGVEVWHDFQKRGKK